jgi:hypothetical protein
MLSIALMVVVSSLAQAKSTSPVSLEYNEPENIVAGQVVTTTVRLTANTDLPSLTVSASADTGLLLISSNEHAVFTNLKRGDIREIEVTIQLDNDLGYVVMQIASTDSMNRDRHQSLALRFGEPNTALRARLSPENIIVDSSGETLFLMKAEEVN